MRKCLRREAGARTVQSDTPYTHQLLDRTEGTQTTPGVFTVSVTRHQISQIRSLSKDGIDRFIIKEIRVLAFVPLLFVTQLREMLCQRQTINTERHIGPQNTKFVTLSRFLKRFTALNERITFH